MAIKSKEEMTARKIEIDLTGPQGNAYFLMGAASKYAKQLGKKPEPILERMRSGDYESLVKVFEEEFGEYVDLYR